MSITAVQTGTNAKLIATAQALYPMSGRVLDLTPGPKDGWWRDFVPGWLIRLPKGEDFRHTSYEDRRFDHVCFDPPYVTKGGHSTSTIPEMSERYGMLHVEKNPVEQWENQIMPGLVEAHRLLDRHGLLWFKCMDYVTSGRVWWFTKSAYTTLATMGFDLVDEFILAGNPGPQPSKNRDGTPRRQVHARKGHSALLIARKL